MFSSLIIKQNVQNFYDIFAVSFVTHWIEKNLLLIRKKLPGQKVNKGNPKKSKQFISGRSKLLQNKKKMYGLQK